MSKLYIPNKISVGFVKRKDTFTGKLAYITYYDSKGVLRKEKSWDSWRDDKIEPEYFENKPQLGFVLNKNVERYNWGRFGSNRSYIRIYDPRGIEFEITPENLIGILMTGGCHRREIEGEYVYAWLGRELILLPVNSEDYLQAQEHTKFQSMKLGCKDLVAGRSYTSKSQEEMVYMGRFDWYTKTFSRKYGHFGERGPKKKHIFWSPKSKTECGNFLALSGADKIAICNNEEPVLNFAKLMDDLSIRPEMSTYSHIESSQIKGKIYLKRSVALKYLTFHKVMEDEKTIHEYRLTRFLDEGSLGQDHPKTDFLRRNRYSDNPDDYESYYGIFLVCVYHGPGLSSSPRTSNMRIGDMTVNFKGDFVYTSKSLDEIEEHIRNRYCKSEIVYKNGYRWKL